MLTLAAGPPPFQPHNHKSKPGSQSRSRAFPFSILPGLSPHYPLLGLALFSVFLPAICFFSLSFRAGLAPPFRSYIAYCPALPPASGFSLSVIPSRRRGISGYPLGPASTTLYRLSIAHCQCNRFFARPFGLSLNDRARLPIRSPLPPSDEGSGAPFGCVGGRELETGLSPSYPHHL